GNFFTKDLDDLVIDGQLDCAIHSAKDIPDPVNKDIDWVWLPWIEDPRDVIVLPKDKILKNLVGKIKIGVSSERREKYCKQRFPNAKLLTIRGNIEDRISQLDSGKYDMIIMAGAALLRLNLEVRITEWISLKSLPTPEGQGTLALTFKKGDKRFLALRSLFVKSVTFAGAGVGSAGLCNETSLKAIRNCDICLHDYLQDETILEELSETAKSICVGKRSGRDSISQKNITEMIVNYARKGFKVVRLKSGDPCIFGRIAEEVEELKKLRLPYFVVPGISSVNAATASTGMLLTRRNFSNGFTVMTPRKAGGGIASINSKARLKVPLVFFMAINIIREVVDELIKEGLSKTTPAAIVFGAYSDDEIILRGNLENICEKVEAIEKPNNPGLIIVGTPATFSFDKTAGAFAGRKILLTCSEALQSRASEIVRNFGGIPVQKPLIKLTLNEEFVELVKKIKNYDWIVITSPSAVRCFLELLKKTKVDLRNLPKIMVCGNGTKKELEKISIIADAAPAFDFGTEGILKIAKKTFVPGQKILRLRSEKSGTKLADEFRKLDVTVDEKILYRNEKISYETCPDFDAVFFASASAVESFDKLWGISNLKNKPVLAIGKPTKKLLGKKGVTKIVEGKKATVKSSLFALATYFIKQALFKLDI
ncbi:MAG: uroporphyrinogen-III C-methyltransferase, partial [Alphaproteobacteria bacterium]